MQTLKIMMVGVCLLSCIESTIAADWYKGAVHVHNSGADGDASSSLSDMMQMYRDVLDFNFVFSTPHHFYLTRAINDGVNPVLFTAAGQFDTSTFKAWDGEEVTTQLWIGGTARHRHIGALGKTRIDPVLNTESGSIIPGLNTLQDIIDHINTYPDPLLTIINHPAWEGLDAAEILAGSDSANHIEVLNAFVTPGDANIRIWDDILSSGRQMYPIGADDAHSTNWPGHAWIVVWAEALTMTSVLDAMSQGKLYASVGPVVTFYHVDDTKMVVEAVQGTVTPPCCIGHRHVDPINEIRFVGQNGATLKSVSFSPISGFGELARAEYDLLGTEQYVRAEVRTGHVTESSGIPELALLPAYFPGQSPPLTMGTEGITPPSVPELTDPAPGSVLPSSTVTFKWTDNGSGVTTWWLRVGTIPGGGNLHNNTFGASQTAAVVSGLPTDGSPIYVQLRLRFGPQGWVIYEYQYVAAGGVSNQPPVAAASANVTSGETPLTVDFSSSGSNDSDGTIIAYAWDFGDGNSSSSDNPTYTYTTANDYTAVLTVTDDDGETDSDSVSITVTSSGGQECLLDVDQNETVDVATDIVYLGRHLLALAPVPPSFRAVDPSIAPDAAIAATIDAVAALLDVDTNGAVDVATDIVYIGRHLLALAPVPPSFRAVDPSIAPDAAIAATIDALCP